MKLPGNKNSGEKSIYVVYGSVVAFLQSAVQKVFSSHLVSFNHYHVVAGADDGIEEIEGGGVILKCLQTRTGIKFVLT